MPRRLRARLLLHTPTPRYSRAPALERVSRTVRAHAVSPPRRGARPVHDDQPPPGGAATRLCVAPSRLAGQPTIPRARCERRSVRAEGWSTPGPQRARRRSLWVGVEARSTGGLDVTMPSADILMAAPRTVVRGGLCGALQDQSWRFEHGAQSSASPTPPPHLSVIEDLDKRHAARRAPVS